MPLTKVTSSAITDSAVTTAKIEDGTIVNADISASANIAQSKLSLSLPTISSISIQDSQGAIPPSDTSLYFDIIGTNFSNPSTVELLDSSTNASTNATTVTYVSATQLRVTASLSAGTYKIRVTRSDGFSGISATALLTVSQAVSWSTSAGSLGTFDEGLAISTITLSATSNSSVTYAVQSGSLPSGLSLSSAGAITGTPSEVASDTTSTFTVRATDAESQYADREFTITVTNVVIQQSLRFNDGDSAYLSKTPSASNRKTWTFSTWVKRGDLNTSSVYLGVGTASTDMFQILLQNDGGANKLIIQDRVSGTNNCNLQTTQAIRDPSAWYHIVVAADSTDATDSNRVKVYINGSQVTDFSTETYPSQDYQFHVNNNIAHHIGSQSKGGTGDHFDGYLAEVHFIDGTQKQASDFGSTDSTTGTWKPKTYSGTYGTNGFYLDFNNTSDFGEDQSGNSNNFTANNLAAVDQVKDTPQNNFAIINPLDKAPSLTLSEGNCQLTSPGNGTYNYMARGNFIIPENSGKWFWEVKVTSSFIRAATGISQISSIASLSGSDTNSDPVLQDGSPRVWIVSHGGGVEGAGSASSAFSGCAWNSQNDIATFMYDSDAGEIYFAVNGTIGNGGSAIATGITGDVTPIHRVYGTTSGPQTTTIIVNHGAPAYSISSAVSDDNGYGSFEYAPLSGYKSLCTNNLPEPTIKDSSAYFNTVLYTGDGSSDNDITVGFQPDLTWIRGRSNTGDNQIHDSSRTANSQLVFSTANAESTNANFGGFTSTGFNLAGSGGSYNASGQTYVAFNWLVNGGTTSSNTSGTITSTVQTNSTAGISIGTYTGNGSNGATVGHGLGSVPDWIIIKNRNSNSTDWAVWPRAYNPAGTNAARINTTAAFGGANGAGFFNDTAPTSTLITLGTRGEVNSNTDGHIFYAFKSIPGFSRFGVYNGNGNADGTFVYTGFRPGFLVVKKMNATDSWLVLDSKRDTFNDDNAERVIVTNSNGAENVDAGSIQIDFTSNGFKCKSSGGEFNGSSNTHIFWAIAESPFGGILTNEATAR